MTSDGVITTVVRGRATPHSWELNNGGPEPGGGAFALDPGGDLVLGVPFCR